jgi:hypothetical protein
MTDLAVSIDTALVVATEPVAALERLRVPYAVLGAGPTPVRGAASLVVLASPGSADGPSLSFPRAIDPASACTGPCTFGRLPVYAPVMTDAAAEALLRDTARVWNRERPIFDAAGRTVGSSWSSADGSVFLPFDPDDAVLSLESERYRADAEGARRRSVRRFAKSSYYAARPLLPRRAQLWLRRRLRRLQERSRFPRYPFDAATLQLDELVVGYAARIVGQALPAIAPWPAPHRWALVLTHDVETQVGHDAVAILTRVERRLGLRSSWNFVPERYRIDPTVLEGLRTDGFEIGVHGLRHDGRDLASLETLNARLPAMRAAATAWGAVGFRSPATHRVYDWMPTLGFAYDSSYPDTDPYEPQPGGCCAILPFFNQAMVELPITMPQDHTLFEILGHHDEASWVQKAAALREAGGMCLMITHPDYMLDPFRVAAYTRFLEDALTHEPWCALPRDAADWWRDRAGSRIVRTPEGWRVDGPAHDRAAIRMCDPQ